MLPTVETLLNQARQLIGENQWQRAGDIIQQGVALAGKDANTLNTAAALYSRCERHKEAKALYLRALTIMPNNAQLHYNLGTVQRFLGELSQAAENFDRAFALNPNDHEALCLSAKVKKQTLNNNHINEIESFLSRPNVDSSTKVQLYYALAKEYEDLEKWGLSFTALQQGASLKRQKLQYNVRHDQEIMSDIAQHHHSVNVPSATNKTKDKTPIFILGLPRTGSTLIESIIGSHTDIEPGSEMPDFSRQLDQLITDAIPKGGSQSIGERIAASTMIDYQELGENYLKSVAGKTKNRAYFTDKMPFNFLYCGLILQALPNAKIIHTRRNPLDSCYAIYKTIFHQAYPYSYDLEELSDYFIAYWTLMEHWRQLMPTQILDVDYEDTVADTESQAKRIIDFCGLNWDPSCLDYQTTKTSITTASAAQVRQPVYNSSVEKWRNVEDQFELVVQKFKAAGIVE